MSVALVATFLAVPATAPAAGVEIVVDPTDVDCDNDTGPVYCDANYAIAAASSGDIIALAAGTHSVGTFDYVVDTVLAAKDLTIRGEGEGVTILDGEGNGGGIRLRGPATYTIEDLTITDGSTLDGAGIHVQANVTVHVTDVTVELSTASQSGGGMFVSTGSTVSLNSVTIDTNTATGSGGGLAIGANSAVTITGSDFTDNAAGEDGGGIYASGNGISITVGLSTISGGDAADRGAGVFFDSSGGTFTLTDTEVVDNVAVGAGGGASLERGAHVVEGSLFHLNTAGSHGGGIHHNQLAGAGNSIAVRNSTFSANGAAGDGGGLYANGTLVNSTATGNTATGRGGGIARNASGTVTVRNSIIFGNTATQDPSQTNDCYNAVSDGYNLVGTASGTCFTSVDATTQYATDPDLAILADNGGPTRTHAIDETSPAFDEGNPATPGSGGNSCESADQRGLPRGPNRCDVGAFELQVGSSITGSVSRAATGEDLAGIDVTLYDSEGAEVDSATTTGDGTYTFGSLDGGSYTVRFANASPPYLVQWWKNRASADAANTITLGNGSDVEDIDAAVEEPRVIRLAGANRYATAAAVSAHHYPDGTASAFVATGLNFPDALAGAAAAATEAAPLLLTASVPAPTATELTRLAPEDILVLGGTSAISAATATSLGAYGTVERLSGADRYLTAIEISKHAYPVNGSADVVVVATGTNFPDALAAASAAVALGGPVLLTPPNALPAVVAAEIERLDPDEILVLGGSAAISGAVFNALDAIAPATRVSGADRYATAVAVSAHVFTVPADVDRVYIAVGTNFPDALAGAAAAAAMGAPVLLVQSNSVPAAVAAEITRLGPTHIYILGGTAVISAAVEAQLAALIP